MSSNSSNTFDFNRFIRLLWYTKPYAVTFYGVLLAAITLSFLAVSRPYLLNEIITTKLYESDEKGLVVLVAILTGILFLEVIIQFLFIFFANWVGQSIIKDIRVKLFQSYYYTLLKLQIKE